MNKSFTIVELVVTIVILLILAAIAIPRLNMRKDAQRAACYGSIEAIHSALASYYSRRAILATAAFPDSITNPDFLAYLDYNRLPRHPSNRNWNDYYSVINNGTGYTLESGKTKLTGACTGF